MEVPRELTVSWVVKKPQTKDTGSFGCAPELQWAVFLMFLAEIT